MIYFWLVITIQEKGKYYAYAQRISTSDDIKSFLERFKGLLHANITPTKKRALEIAKCWNDSYKNNGTYLFSSPTF